MLYQKLALDYESWLTTEGVPIYADRNSPALKSGYQYYLSKYYNPLDFEIWSEKQDVLQLFKDIVNNRTLQGESIDKIREYLMSNESFSTIYAVRGVMLTPLEIMYGRYFSEFFGGARYSDAKGFSTLYGTTHYAGPSPFSDIRGGSLINQLGKTIIIRWLYRMEQNPAYPMFTEYDWNNIEIIFAREAFHRPYLGLGDIYTSKYTGITYNTPPINGLVQVLDNLADSRKRGSEYPSVSLSFSGPASEVLEELKRQQDEAVNTNPYPGGSLSLAGAWSFIASIVAAPFTAGMSLLARTLTTAVTMAAGSAAGAAISGAEGSDIGRAAITGAIEGATIGAASSVYEKAAGTATKLALPEIELLTPPASFGEPIIFTPLTPTPGFQALTFAPVGIEVISQPSALDNLKEGWSKLKASIQQVLNILPPVQPLAIPQVQTQISQEQGQEQVIYAQDDFSGMLSNIKFGLENLKSRLSNIYSNETIKNVSPYVPVAIGAAMVILAGAVLLKED